LTPHTGAFMDDKVDKNLVEKIR